MDKKIISKTKNYNLYTYAINLCTTEMDFKKIKIKK